MDKRLSAVLLVLLLAGCIPIAPAHKNVQVAPLEIQVQWAASDAGLEIIRPRFWDEREAFLAIVRDAPRARDERYALEGSASMLEFPAETRYVAGPAISFLPEDPLEGKWHVFFVRMRPAGDALYRVIIEGRRARVERTSLAAARGKWSPVLDRPEPPSSDWRALGKWSEPRQEFYRATPWKATEELRVVGLIRGRERDVLSLHVGADR